MRSASKKGRALKSIDFSDAASNPRVPNATSPTMRSPVPPREVSRVYMCEHVEVAVHLMERLAFVLENQSKSVFILPNF